MALINPRRSAATAHTKRDSRPGEFFLFFEKRIKFSKPPAFYAVYARNSCATAKGSISAHDGRYEKDSICIPFSYLDQ